jgi:hypothetical protein
MIYFIIGFIIGFIAFPALLIWSAHLDWKHNYEEHYTKRQKLSK